MVDTEIVWSDFGLADRMDDKIVLNKALKRDRELLAWVLKHELSHLGGKFTIDDLKLDFDLLHDLKHRRMVGRLLLFQLLHPSTWTQMLPVRFYGGDLYFDISNLIVWLLCSPFILLFLWWWF